MRHFVWGSVVAGVALSSSPVSACELMTGLDIYRPTMAPADPENFLATVPKPRVEIVKITRGTAAPGRTCNDAGIIELAVSPGTPSTYSVDQLGVYVRVIEGTQPDQIFYNAPMIGPVADGKMKFIFGWLDGHPSRQKPLHLKVEAFFVSNWLVIGPSTTFEVRNP
jgi:hypothetical protein